MTSEMIHKLQHCLATLPVEKAWLFGSYSRGEEQPDSDIDLLVRFDADARISLFKYAGIILALEAAMGKEVDLVQAGCSYQEKRASFVQKVLNLFILQILFRQFDATAFAAQLVGDNQVF